MPSRPVLIGRGLVTHPPPHHNTCDARVHYPESEPTNPPPNTNTPTGDTGTRSQQNNGSQRYGGHSGRETPGPIPNPEVKPASANGTAPDRMWESRTPPNITLPMGAIFGWPPSLSWGSSFARPSNSSRGVRARGRRSSSVERGSARGRSQGGRPGSRAAACARRRPRPTPSRRSDAAAAVGRRRPPQGRLVAAGRRAGARAPRTRSGTTVRRCPRRSPAVSSTAR